MLYCCCGPTYLSPASSNSRTVPYAETSSAFVVSSWPWSASTSDWSELRSADRVLLVVVTAANCSKSKSCVGEGVREGGGEERGREMNIRYSIDMSGLHKR